ncbi:MAG: hypothetical protein K2J32_00560 [Ruminococcus sp.]|nr:hypothetical protein [Ruminococcus sp.]
MKIYLLFWIIADIVIWSGIYSLSAKVHIRRAKIEGFVPQRRTLRICFIISWIVVHVFFAWALYEFVKWGGMD